MVGGFYQNFKLFQHDVVGFAPPIAPVPFVADEPFDHQLTNAGSVFGQVTYDITSTLQLSGGARYSIEHKSQSDMRGPSELNGFNPTSPVPVAVPKVTFHNVSPEATIRFKPSTRITLYATYRTGFTSGGFNLQTFQPAGVDNSFKPETVKGGEIGAKGVAFGHQLQFDAAAYRYHYRDLQLTTLVQGAGAPVISVTNAGAATAYGAEAALVYSPDPIPGLSLRGSLAYNHSRYDRFITDCYPGQSIAAGCNLAPVNGVFQGQNLAGRPLKYAADWNGSIGATYQANLSSHLRLTPSVDGIYSGSYFTYLEEAPQSRQAAFWKVNASIVLQTVDDSWELALIGKNLTNKLTISNSLAETFTGSGTGTAMAMPANLTGNVEAPHTVLLQLTVRNNLFH